MLFWRSAIPMLIGVLLLFDVAQAQSVGRISGTVTDAASGEKLEAVQVYLPALKLGTVSDEDGRFVIENVPLGAHELSSCAARCRRPFARHLRTM